MGEVPSVLVEPVLGVLRSVHPEVQCAGRTWLASLGSGRRGPWATLARGGRPASLGKVWQECKEGPWGLNAGDGEHH